MACPYSRLRQSCGGSLVAPILAIGPPVERNRHRKDSQSQTTHHYAPEQNALTLGSTIGSQPQRSRQNA